MPEIARTYLHFPGDELASCVFGAVERDTQGVELSDRDRLNCYPATPMAAISWTFVGTFHQVASWQHDEPPTLGPPLPRLLFSGPQRQPTASWSPASVHSIIVGFYPEALGELLDARIDAYVDRVLPLEAVVPPDFFRACEAIYDGMEPVAPFARIQNMLEKYWRGQRPRNPAPLMRDWIRSLATRAAHSSAGRSMRQLQRFIKHRTGQSHRDLMLYARLEEAFIQRMENRQGAAVDLSALALDAGYSDQSHMGREFRRVTGLPPARLEELIANDEAFWYYRLVDGWVEANKPTCEGK
jgi:AraC-like DNA-binding protein